MNVSSCDSAEGHEKNPDFNTMRDSSKKKAPPSSAEPVRPLPLKALTSKFGALHPHDSVETAGARMRQHGAPAWPVADDQKLVGMVDEQNPDWKIGGHGHDPKSWKVGQIMSRDVIFCYEDEDCTAARTLMEQSNLRYLPVVDRDMRIVGIFSRDEIQEKAEAKAGPPSLKKRASKPKHP
jgi:CBS domain-containing protein